MNSSEQVHHPVHCYLPADVVSFRVTSELKKKNCLVLCICIQAWLSPENRAGKGFFVWPVSLFWLELQSVTERYEPDLKEGQKRQRHSYTVCLCLAPDRLHCVLIPDQSKWTRWWTQKTKHLKWGFASLMRRVMLFHTPCSLCPPRNEDGHSLGFSLWIWWAKPPGCEPWCWVSRSRASWCWKLPAGCHA